MAKKSNTIIQKIFSNYLFRVMAAWFGVYIVEKIAATRLQNPYIVAQDTEPTAEQKAVENAWYFVENHNEGTLTIWHGNHAYQVQELVPNQSE